MNALKYRLGFALRETGQALERVGCVLQGINSYAEEITQLNPILHSKLKLPKVASTAWVAPSAQVAGDVKIGDNSSVWYNCYVRGDSQPVQIGHNTNLQDGAYVGSLKPGSGSTTVGSFVSVGHGAVLQSCSVADQVLIGMNAVLQEGVKVESGAMVAAGAVVSPGTTIPSGELWAGNPAKKLRELKSEEKAYLEALPTRYQQLAGQHKEVLKLLHARIEAIVGAH